MILYVLLEGEKTKNGGSDSPKPYVAVKVVRMKKASFSSEEDEKADDWVEKPDVTVLSLFYKVARVCRSCKTYQHDCVVYKCECVGGEEENHYLIFLQLLLYKEYMSIYMY